MRNDALQPGPTQRTPRQNAANRRLALCLALFALGVFVSFVLRQWWVSNP